MRENATAIESAAKGEGVAGARERIDPALLARARQAYELVGRRKALLGERLFFDPAWAMLLDLFISEASGRRLSVTALCIGSQASTATALRYTTALVDEGLVERTADQTDGRRSHVHLTQRGLNVMKTLLSQ